MTDHWAKINAEGVVLNVEVAAEGWVAAWEADNPDSTDRYVPTDYEAVGYAAIGYSLDEETGCFIPPDPQVPGVVFDRETWEYVGWPIIEDEEEAQA